MHVVIHSQYYPPEVGAPQTRWHELALRLTQHGLRVTVLTAMPNYPRGRVYDGYGGWSRTERLNGIDVVRSAIYPYQGIRLLPRLLSYFSFVFSSLWVGWRKVDQADFVITESPPLFLGISGFILSRLKRARWIFNISDLWPQSAVELGVIRPGGVGDKFGSLLEKFLYGQAWVVTCQSRGILERIQERFPNIRTYHLPNGVDTAFFQPCDQNKAGNDFKLVYAGLHGLAQGLDQILQAAYELPTSNHVAFTLIGDGPEKQKLVGLAGKLNLKTVDFLPAVSKDEIPGMLQEADAIIVSLKVQLTGAVPSKLYEAMAVGKPVILIAQGEAARIVNDSRCGIVVMPGDVQGLISAIHYLMTHPAECTRMGKNGREASVRNHDRCSIADSFAAFLKLEQPRTHE